MLCFWLVSDNSGQCLSDSGIPYEALSLESESVLQSMLPKGYDRQRAMDFHFLKPWGLPIGNEKGVHYKGGLLAARILRL